MQNADLRAVIDVVYMSTSRALVSCSFSILLGLDIYVKECRFRYILTR